MSVLNEDYPRNVAYTLNMTSTFFYNCLAQLICTIHLTIWHSWSVQYTLLYVTADLYNVPYYMSQLICTIHLTIWHSWSVQYTLLYGTADLYNTPYYMAQLICTMHLTIWHMWSAQCTLLYGTLNIMYSVNYSMYIKLYHSVNK